MRTEEGLATAEGRERALQAHALGQTHCPSSVLLLRSKVRVPLLKYHHLATVAKVPVSVAGHYWNDTYSYK